MTDCFTGRVTVIFPKRKYGFIAPDEPGPNLFFHGEIVVGNGFEDLREGSRVRYTIGQDRKKRTVAATVEAVQGSPGDNTETGVIVRIIPAGGFGFIKKFENGENIFFHYMAYLGNFADLQIGRAHV